MASLREQIPLRISKVIKKCMAGAILILVLMGFSAIFVVPFLLTKSGKLSMEANPYVFVGWLLFFGFLLCWNPIYQMLYFKRYFYDIDGKNIVIRKGVIAQKEITLPFSRITDVYVDRDLLDVLFGLYDVHISTPTEESGRFAHIDGVDKEGSRQLRQMILDNINTNES